MESCVSDWELVSSLLWAAAASAVKPRLKSIIQRDQPPTNDKDDIDSRVVNGSVQDLGSAA